MELEKGRPLKNGHYICWVDQKGLPYANKLFLIWHDGRWSYPSSDQFYRGHVYQFMGPLPALKLES